jgi:hypothetical protein
MDLEENEAWNDCAGEELQSIWQSVVTESAESYSCEKREAGSWVRSQFGNPQEDERPTLEAATKQRLVKTEKTLCVSQWQRRGCLKLRALYEFNKSDC